MLRYMIAALAIVAFGIILAYRKRDDISDMSLSMTACLSLAITVLVFPYYMMESDLPIAVIEAIRAGISGIAMGVNGEIPYEMELEGNTFRFFRFFLYALYIAGPLAGSVFLLSFSIKLKTLFSFIGKKRFHIFSRLNERSYRIASSIYEEKIGGVILFCNASDADADLANRARNLKALLSDRDETRISLRPNRKYEFYEIDEDDRRRIRSLSILCESLLKQKNYDAKNVVVRALACEKQKELLFDLDRQYSDRIHITHIDEGNALAIEALSLCRDLLAVKKDCDIRIFSDEDASIALLKNLICLSIKPEGSNRIVFASDRIGDLQNSFYKDVPEADHYDLSFVSCRKGEEDELLDERPDLVFVLYKSDEEAYETAGMIRRKLSAAYDDAEKTMILCRIADGDLCKIISDHTITLYGDMKKIWSYDKLLNPDLEDAAKRVHLSYMHALNESDPEKLLKESGYYQYQNREASFAQALALTYKKAYILSQKKNSDVSDRQFIDDYLSQEENMKKMADAEHERWNAFERTHGWRFADKEKTKAIIRKYDGKRANDPELKLHPALVENDELPKTEEMVNELLAEYGSSYRVAYLDADRDIISGIGDILKI